MRIFLDFDGVLRRLSSPCAALDPNLVDDTPQHFRAGASVLVVDSARGLDRTCGQKLRQWLKAIAPLS